MKGAVFPPTIKSKLLDHETLFVNVELAAGGQPECKVKTVGSTTIFGVLI